MTEIEVKDKEKVEDSTDDKSKPDEGGDDAGEKKDEFDINKFNSPEKGEKEEEGDKSSSDDSTKNKEPESKGEAGDDSSSEKGEGKEKEKEGELSWDVFSEPESKSESEGSKTDSKEDKGKGEKVPEPSQNGEAEKAILDKISAELGVSGSNVDDIVKQLKEKQVAVSAPDTDKTKEFRSLLSLKDEDLIKEDAKSQGFTDEEQDEYLEKLVDNGTIKFEAKKLRGGINNAIKTEESLAAQSIQQQSEAQKKEAEESRQKLEEHLSKTEEVLGIKMAKDDEGLEKVRKEHFNYITSGQFFKEVTDDEASVSEAAFLWKNRNNIAKALKTKGYEKGKADILNELKNPDMGEKGTGVSESSDNGEFKPGKFMDDGGKMDTKST